MQTPAPSFVDEFRFVLALLVGLSLLALFCLAICR
jgi:hypothetical protein